MEFICEAIINYDTSTIRANGGKQLLLTIGQQMCDDQNAETKKLDLEYRFKVFMECHHILEEDYNYYLDPDWSGYWSPKIHQDKDGKSYLSDEPKKVRWRKYIR